MDRNKPLSKVIDYPPLNIVYRDKWNAVPPVEEIPMKHPIETIIFTHTFTRQCSTLEDCTRLVRDLQTKQMTEGGMADIQFNWLVGAEGSIFEGRGWDVQPKLVEDHYREYDGKAISIAFIGTYIDTYPSDELFNTSALLCLEAINGDVLDPTVKLVPLPVSESEKNKPVTPNNEETSKQQETSEEKEGGDNNKVKDKLQETPSVEDNSGHVNNAASTMFPLWLDEQEF